MKRKGQLSQQRIVDAASALFYRQGYGSTSFAEVARASGIPKGNFYYYFKSKDDLLGAVIDAHLDAIRGRLAQWEHDEGDPRGRLKRLLLPLQSEADAITRWGCPVGSLNVELGKGSPDRKAHARAMLDLQLAWADRQMRALGHAATARELAIHLVGMIQGAALMGGVYADRDLLEAESARIRAWLDAL